MTPLHFDFSNCRIGDKAVAGWMFAATAFNDGRSVSFTDPSAQDHGNFPVREFFRCLDDYEVGQEDDSDTFHTGNLWINARHLFKQLGGLGPVRMMSPIGVDPFPVAMHILTDAPYNTVRNWTWEQGIELAKRMESELGVWPWVVPPRGASNQLPAAAVMCKIAAAKMFIGGDSGFSHAYAMMRPDAPITWIGHDMADDKATYGPDFDSSPISDHVTRFHLSENKFDMDAVLAHVAEQLRKQT